MAVSENLEKRLRAREEPLTLPTVDDGLETKQQFKERWRSIYIVYFTVFLMSLGFSIILAGVWPFLDKLDPTAGKEFMGYIVAACPLGQMIFSPLVGWWSNKLGSIRMPLLSSLVVFAIASAGYSCLELIDSYRKYWMLVTRLLVGVSSANIAVCRSYLSAATRVSERTKAVSMVSLAQVLGFIVGPSIQAAVVPLGNEGVWLIQNKLQLNMYTATGWINVLLAFFNIYLFVPSVFKEHKIAVREAMLKHGLDNEKCTWKNHKTDYTAAWILVVAFFVVVFNFMLLETLGTPLTMDQFAWTKAESLKYMGILMSVGAVCAIAMFATIHPLSKMFSEAKLMIWGGFLFMVLGRVLYIPWGDKFPEIYDVELKINLTRQCNEFKTELLEYNLTFDNSDYLFNAEFNNTVLNAFEVCNTEFVGCPSTQKWCTYTPAMTLTQFLSGFLITSCGYPLAAALIQTIFSKILGPRPQGIWMGLLTGSGSLSRVSGPVFVSFIYTKFGTTVTFGFTTAMMTACFLWLLYYNERLISKEEMKRSSEKDKELEELKGSVSVPLNDEKVLSFVKD